MTGMREEILTTEKAEHVVAGVDLFDASHLLFA